MVQPHRHCTKNSFNMNISAIDYVTQWLSHVRFFTTPWTVTHQAPLSMGFSRQEYWSGLPFSTPRDLPDPETELTSLASPAMASGFFTTGPQIIIPNLQMRSWRFREIKGFDHRNQTGREIQTPVVIIPRLALSIIDNLYLSQLPLIATIYF